MRYRRARLCWRRHASIPSLYSTRSETSMQPMKLGSRYARVATDWLTTVEFPGVTDNTCGSGQHSLKCVYHRLIVFGARTFDIKITPPFISARGNIPEKNKLSTAFQYWVNKRYARYVTDRQTHRQISQNEACPLVKCIRRYLSGRQSFWSWFDVNRSNFSQRNAWKTKDGRTECNI